MAVELKFELRSPFTLGDIKEFVTVADHNGFEDDIAVGISFTQTGADRHATVDGHPWPIGFTTLHITNIQENQ